MSTKAVKLKLKALNHAELLNLRDLVAEEIKSRGTYERNNPASLANHFESVFQKHHGDAICESDYNYDY